MKIICASSNVGVSNIKSNDKNIYETKHREPNIIRVTKVKTWDFRSGVLYNLKC